MSADYGNARSDRPAPGVYREDQGRPQNGVAPGPVPGPMSPDYTAPAPREAWVEGYRFALLNPDDTGVQADLARYREEAHDRLVAELRAEVAQAREQAAECMREAAQLHRALDSLGTSPEKLAQQVGAGMAVSLFGRSYVDRELASGVYASAPKLAEAGGSRCRFVHPPEAIRCVRVADGGVGACTMHREEVSALLDREDDKREGRLLEPGRYASAELLEAQSGVFVPIPAGHMLSVTVTPYDSTPLPDDDERCCNGNSD